jgi:hypothetical protein
MKVTDQFLSQRHPGYTQTISAKQKTVALMKIADGVFCKALCPDFFEIFILLIQIL